MGRILASGIALTAAFALHAPALFAQTVDSGALMRQQQSPLDRPDTQTKTEDAELQVQQQPAAETREVKSGEKILVKRFKLASPSLLMTDAELNDSLQSFAGRESTLEELNAATLEVADELRLRGYAFVQVLIPQQEVVDGEVALEIVPGKLDANAVNHGIELKTNGPLRLRQDRARAMVASAVSNPQALNLLEVERGLLLLNDLPGVRGTGLIVPGKEPGTLQLALDVHESPLAGGWFSTDNYGSRTTGRARAVGDVRLNNPSGRGDAAELYLAKSEDTGSATASYAMPIGLSGLRTRFALSHMDYRLGEEFESLDGKGESSWVSAGLSYPLLRTRAANLSWTGTMEYKLLKDRLLDTSISDRHSTAVSGGLHGNRVLAGGRRWLDYSTTLTGGNLSRGANPTDLLLDQLSRRTDGSYGILRLTGSWLENFDAVKRFHGKNFKDFSLWASTEIQLANRNLDTSEKIYLGGPRGVRAYPIEEAGSDQGLLLNMEARWLAVQRPEWGGQQWTLFALLDAGHAVRNKNTWDGWDAGNPGLDNRYWLGGGGLGARAQIGGRIQLELLGARKIGHNPGADAAGRDADGHSNQTRFWFAGSMTF